MATGTSSNKEKTQITNIGQLYGPYAFGVVALLTIWFSIVKPELSTRQIDYENQAELVSQLREIHRSQADTSKALESVAESLSATATVLQKTVETIHDLGK